MSATTAGQTLRLDDRETHAASLTLAATRLLRAGQARRAFELADRRCRLTLAPSASDRAVRALAGRLAGWPFWRDDLEAALRADPLDAVVNATLLRLGEPEERKSAALRLVAAPEASSNALEDALSHLFETGVPAALHLDLVDDRLSGWVAWAGAGAATLDIEGATETARVPLLRESQGLPFLPPGASAALIEARLPFEQAGRAIFRLDGAIVAEAPLLGRSRRGEGPLRAFAPTRVPARAPLVVLVPVYEDLSATTACLAAAISETAGRANTRLVVVDDASPNADLARHLRVWGDRGAIDLKRNPLNLGFAGAVRRGLSETGGADVLLLNADTVLPEGALDRLVDTAYGAPDIGTVTPLSNNGEYSSFPIPGVPNPVPSQAEAVDIDRIAASLNLPPVDVPTGTGFCLFLRHDARAAVGEMPSIYGRGYFEDMDFCLRAAEAGFRSVATPAVYVLHHGSLSFGLEKASLVSRNLRILRQRFPATLADCKAFLAADPLRPARAAIEEALRSPETLPLLVARDGSALLAGRLAHHAAQARQLIWSTTDGGSCVRLLGPGGAAPQSLRLTLEDGGDRLGAYLAASAVGRIEIVGSDELPADLIAALGSTDAPIDLVFGDVARDAAPGPDALLAPLALAGKAFAPRLGRAIATETQSLTALQALDALPARLALLDARPVPIAAGTFAPATASATNAPASVGFVCPVPLPSSDAFARVLSGLLHGRGSSARIVILGAAADDLGLMARGNIVVTGPFSFREEADLLRLFGIRALVLPPASPWLAEAERMASAHALPLAIADWTFGLLSTAPSSLFLDPAQRDAGNALATADWLAHRLQTAAA